MKTFFLEIVQLLPAFQFEQGQGLHGVQQVYAIKYFFFVGSQNFARFLSTSKFENVSIKVSVQH